MVSLERFFKLGIVTLKFDVFFIISLGDMYFSIAVYRFVLLNRRNFFFLDDSPKKIKLGIQLYKHKKRDSHKQNDREN